jgi:hypothetical protein
VTDWAAVLSNDFAVPERRSLPDLADELCAMLASPAPQVRDDTAYPILAIWTARGVLDGHLSRLGDRMAGRLGDDEIQARTFAVMILAWVVLRDARTGELAADRVPRWRDAFAAWWRVEADLRGWDARLGWLHAVAHGADALRAFGRSPRLGTADLRGLLDLVVDRLFADAGYLFAHGEDDRIGYALASVLPLRVRRPGRALVRPGCRRARWRGRVTACQGGQGRDRTDPPAGLDRTGLTRARMASWLPDGHAAGRGDGHAAGPGAPRPTGDRPPAGGGAGRGPADPRRGGRRALAQRPLHQTVHCRRIGHRALGGPSPGARHRIQRRAQR